MMKNDYIGVHILNEYFLTYFKMIQVQYLNGKWENRISNLPSKINDDVLGFEIKQLIDQWVKSFIINVQ